MGRGTTRVGFGVFCEQKTKWIATLPIAPVRNGVTELTPCGDRAFGIDVCKRSGEDQELHRDSAEGTLWRARNLPFLQPKVVSGLILRFSPPPPLCGYCPSSAEVAEE